MYRSRNIDSYEDLDLTLGLSPKRFHAFGTTFHGGFPELITIEDDDDNDGEMPVFPQGPSQTIRFYTRYSSWTSVISDEDLELRLGPKVVTDPSDSRSGQPPLFGNMKKLGQASSSQTGLEVHQLKFRCSICMDTMKEETSTVCGHVFCKVCITNAIRIQNRCPTCREKLTQSSIHRIYLPGTTCT